MSKKKTTKKATKKKSPSKKRVTKKSSSCGCSTNYSADSDGDL